MKPAALEHPTPAQLSAFGLGRLDPAERAAIEGHVAECDVCCQALREVGEDGLIHLLRAADTPRSAGQRGLDPTLVGTPAPTPRPTPLEEPAIPPELIDHPRYRVLARIGIGGMGVVYRAEHRFMERPVALKVVSRELLNNPGAVERFTREVKAAARLSHPNIVTAHDADQAGELHFLVMEHVDGTSLARIVEKRGPLPVLHACHYIRQAALGLQHAHEKGMVHRDIKPHNLMLTRKGQVKILDFGLARLARECSQPELIAAGAAVAPQPGLTSVGMVLGTPDYIAPEQIQDARAADIRSDIYSLGCTLYLLLSGRVPFPTGGSLEKMMQHATERAPALAGLRPELPSAVVAIVEKMMAKKPEDRFQTPLEAAQVLLPWARTAPPAPGETPDGGLAMAVLLPESDTLSGEVRQDTLAEKPSRSRIRPKPRFKPKRQFPLGAYLRPAALVAALGLMAVGLWLAYQKYGLPEFDFLRSRSENLAAKTDTQTAPPNTGGSKNPSDGPGPAITAAKTGSGKDGRVPGTRRPRVLIVLASNGFYYPDYGPVRQALDKAQALVDVAALNRNPAMPMPRFGNSITDPSVKPDLTLEEAKASNYDMVVFCGGHGVLKEYCAGGPGFDAAVRLIEAMLTSDKYVTALCGGPAVLADAGALKGRDAICFKSDPRYVQKLIAGKATKVDQPVVESGKVITGRGPEDAQEFARVLIERLEQLQLR